MTTVSGIVDVLSAVGPVILVLMMLIMILWILLPFAVFGIKPLLRKLAFAADQRDAAMLSEMRKISKALGDRADAPLSTKHPTLG